MISPQFKLADLFEETSLKFKAAKVVEGMMIGIHHSPFHGFSSEFAQHRPYQPGDDLRYFDWKVWAKNERKYVKQFNEETNLLSTIILDCSKSMNFPKNRQTKWEYASILSASLIHTLLKQRDGVGLILASDDVKVQLNPKTYSWYESTLFETIEKAVPDQETKLQLALKKAAQVHQRRGLLIIISDFMQPLEDLKQDLKFLRSQHHDLIAVQILDPMEIDLDEHNEVLVKDLETNQKIETNFTQIKSAYQTAFINWQTELKQFFRDNQIDFFSAKTTDAFSPFLRQILQVRNRVGNK